MSRVLVFGAGPAGLMATHAAALGDHDVIVMSHKGRKSKMMGAQYLHAPIPMANKSKEFLVSYRMEGGTPQEYRRKVYGDAWDGTVSPEDLEENHKGWDIREAYDWLWETYHEYVTDFTADHWTKVREAVEWANADLVISTIPAPLLCHEEHSFGSTTIFSGDRAMGHMDDNTVICNAGEAPTWYRAARICGWDTVEWPGLGPKPPITPVWEVTKPTKTNCTCFPEIVRMGRYGSWTKGTLSHEAFYNTSKELENLQERLF